MNSNNLSKYSISQLKDFRRQLCSDSMDRSGLIEYINKKIAVKEENAKECDYSSDRMPYYRKEYEKKCFNFLKMISVEDFKFLQESFNMPYVNRKFDLHWKKILSMPNLNDSTPGLLSTLEAFFKEPENIYDYEGVYNTLNYIKNYIYYCLGNNGSLDIFKDYDKKVKLTTAILPAIAEYLYDIKSDTKLQLSIGNVGLAEAASPIFTELDFNMKRIAEAIAFGTTLEKLENGDYSDAKRLLFLPRYVCSE